jgi:hypothetical protein
MPKEKIKLGENTAQVTVDREKAVRLMACKRNSEARKIVLSGNQESIDILHLGLRLGYEIAEEELVIAVSAAKELQTQIMDMLKSLPKENSTNE